MSVTSQPIKLYDTTLRDGVQREGISLTLDDKLKIAAKLDAFGIHYIEGGFPGSNPKDREFFSKAIKLDLSSILVAFSSTRRKNIPVEEDQSLATLVEVGVSAVCIFGKSWDVHVSEALLTTLDENLKMIGDSVRFLKDHGLEVIYDAEHFFDGYHANPEYTMDTIRAAEAAGADWIILCDTNGGQLPHDITPVVERVVDLVKVPVGIHARGHLLLLQH